MNPVEQRSLHDPDAGTVGDCFSAVIASLLHVPLSYVPIFEGAEGEWVRNLNAWLKPFGLAYVTLDPGLDLSYYGISGMYHEVAGPSPRFPDLLHSVVAEDLNLIHDPHPTKSMIPRVDGIGIFIVLQPWLVLPKTKLLQHISELKQQHIIRTGKVPSEIYMSKEVLEALNNELKYLNAVHILLEPIAFNGDLKVSLCTVHETTGHGITFE